MRLFCLIIGSLLCSGLRPAHLPYAHTAPKTDDPIERDLIHRSIDGGNTWQNVSTGLPDKSAVSGAAVNDGTLYVSTPQGIYQMATKSAQWQRMLFVDDHLTHFYLGRGGLYAFGYGAGIYQNLLGTGMWIPKYGSLNTKELCEFIETADGSLFVGDDKGIVRSADGGVHWQRVYSGSTVGNLWADGKGVMLAGGAYPGLIRSTDGGKTWKPLLKKYQEPMRVRMCGNRLVAFVSDRSELANRLLTSDDAGATWKPLCRHLPSSQVIVDVAQVGDALLCSFENGVFRTTDGGNTWTCVRTAAKGVWYELLVVGHTIFLTRGFGC